jgi:chemotaxis protein CheD
VHRPADVVLRPGDFHFAEEGARISTLLGSCVSITMWHPRLLVGGMCHYVVPSRRRPIADLEARYADLDGRYADEAVQLFLREVHRCATRPQEYEVKMFGGGSQFTGAAAKSTVDIPGDNVAVGLQLLAHHGFTLLTRHLGGTGPRQVVFELATGNVWLKHAALTGRDSR